MDKIEMAARAVAKRNRGKLFDDCDESTKAALIADMEVAFEIFRQRRPEELWQDLLENIQHPAAGG